MWRTRVGYAGGTKQAPTYEAIGDHSECVEVDFDPTVVSYEELLDRFWAGHDATSRPFARQYASLILVRDDAQLKAAQASVRRHETSARSTIWTTVERLDRFYPAEDYHQKYYLRHTPKVMVDFEEMYPSDAAFVASTAAARANGLLGAATGSFGWLAEEIGRYGLSETGRGELLDRAGQAGFCAPVSTSAEPSSATPERQ